MEPTGPGLAEMLTVLRRRKLAVAFGTVLGISVALIVSFRQTPLYSSFAEVLVLPVQNPTTDGAATFVIMANELRIAESQAVAALALQTSSRATGGVSVSTTEGTETLIFSSTSTDPQTARVTANAYASAYLGFRRDSLLTTVEKTGDAIRSVVAQLNAEIATLQEEFAGTEDVSERAGLQVIISSKLSELSQQQARLTDLELIQNASVGQFLQRAFTPSAPSSPDHRRAGLLGLIVGIVLGVGLAFLLERLDPTVRSREDVEAATDAPLIAITPQSRLIRRNPSFLATNDRQLSQVFRALRAVILFMASQRTIRSIMITSTREGEGKTTTAANLAIALGESGKRVILILADTWKRPVNDHFGVRDLTGLGDVLVHGLAPLDAVVQTDAPGVMVVPSGVAGGGRDSGFTTGEIREVIERLKPHADLVILDAPPVLAVSDALEAAPAVDSVVLVADVRRLRRADLALAAEKLRSVGADIIGIVATKVVAKRPEGFSKGYGDHGAVPGRISEADSSPRSAVGDSSASHAAPHETRSFR